MMATAKKSLELDMRIESIVREGYAEFENYLPLRRIKQCTAGSIKNTGTKSTQGLRRA